MFTFITLYVIGFAALLAQPQAWGLLLGALTPILVAVLKQPGLAERWQRPLAYAVAGVIGLLTVLASGQFNPTDLLTTLALVLAACQTTYSGLWKPSGITSSVESATNLPPRSDEDADWDDYDEPTEYL